MQLVAYGAQDVYLTGNPQITFMKVVYRRHTNFAMESIEQVFNGQADFGKRVTATISRNGDLIHKVYLQVALPDVSVPAGASFRWLNWIGHVLIKSVELEIGGQRIDKHYGDWIHIWNELSQSAGHQLGYANMVGNIPSLTNPVVGPATVKGTTIFVPLEFFFCRNPGLALPLIALQYHEVKINLEFNSMQNCYWAGAAAAVGPATVPVTDYSKLPTIPSLLLTSLWVDYIYLDTDERRRFAQAAHEYLIEQLQFTGEESTSQTANKIKLNFNHPCKELIWVVQPEDNCTDAAPYGKQWFNYTDAYDYTYDPAFIFNLASTPIDVVTNSASGGMPGIAAGGANQVYLPTSFEGGAGPTKSCKLILNGHDRFYERDGRYFNLVQPYQHHENVPSNGIYVYSFALKPEEHQPSGSCNMSRIDNATLQLTLTDKTVKKADTTSRPAKVKVFAINYNVLRIMSGMGGLAYSN
jgi:hypothetical protein